MKPRIARPLFLVPLVLSALTTVVIQKTYGDELSGQEEIGRHLWFFSAIVPCKINERDFTALSLSFDGLHNPPPTPKTVNKAPASLWISCWAGGVGNAAQLRLSQYDFARDVPRVVNQGVDSYFFFFRGADAIVPSAPVMRRSGGGWAWQTLDTVEASARRQAYIADLPKGKIVNALGEQIADVNEIKKTWPEALQAVDLGVTIREKTVYGVAGLPLEIPSTKEKPKIERPPLPYKTVYYYQVGADGTKATALPIITPDEKTSINNRQEALSLDKAALVSTDDEIFFGQPVLVPQAPGQIYYWYALRSKLEPKRVRFFLAHFDSSKAGNNTTLVDGVTFDLPASLKFWNGTAWIQHQEQPYWSYQPYLKVMIQPLVGTDVNGQVIVYRPPSFYKIQSRR